MLDVSRLIRYKRSDFVVIVRSLKKGSLRCGTIPADLRTLFDAVSIVAPSLPQRPRIASYCQFMPRHDNEKDDDSAEHYARETEIVGLGLRVADNV
jgi:hypothetical protein